MHLDDDEAEEIWIDAVGVPPERVQRRDRDNFWQMGVAGPAGPCSEIFYDKGPAYGADGGPVVDEERFVEIWNLVFMQNIQDEPYHVVGDLPAKSIDTGAGLERLATVLQGVDALFDTDLIRPVLATAENLTGVAYGAAAGSDVSLRVMADHARAVSFLLADGVVPSNEGRGYVLRRLLRRTVRHAHLLGSERMVMSPLINRAVEVMGRAYPELVAKEAVIVELAEREEHGFRRTLASGHQLLDADLASAQEAGGTLSGESAFRLHDTYGFPIEITEEIVAERGMTLDRAGFDRLMEEQRERARAAFKGGAAADAADAYRTLLRRHRPDRLHRLRPRAWLGSGAQHDQRAARPWSAPSPGSRSRSISTAPPSTPSPEARWATPARSSPRPGRWRWPTPPTPSPGSTGIGARWWRGGSPSGRTPSSPSARCAGSASARTTPAPTCSTGRCGRASAATSTRPVPGSSRTSCGSTSATSRGSTTRHWPTSRAPSTPESSRTPRSPPW